ncbi:MAG: DNA/RNA non-specific endonuclease [Bacteroidales bacterium]|jgi:endonuclease G|nr:DNA/RNA non-specific endonuclease [Bacteroidales bacterium]
MKKNILLLIFILFIILVDSIYAQDNVSSIHFLTNYAAPDYTENAILIEHSAFTISYIDKYKHAEWVSYCLIGSELEKSNVKRTDNFRVDPEYKNCANDRDYSKSGYDRGHLFPAANSCTKEAMNESFYYTNMSPQVPPFNRGIWSKMEAKVRDWAVEYDTIYVVTGAYLKDYLSTIGSGVAVPEYYYKIIVVNTEKTQQALAFFIRNEKGKSDKLQDFVVPVDVVELIIEKNFCVNLDENLQDCLEFKVNLDDWSW